MRFVKLHGCGNDYLFVRGEDLPAGDVSALVSAMSDRHTGVGSDGLIALFPSDQADVKMVMYNADGRRGRMCGNGIRCAARWALEEGLTAGHDLKEHLPTGVERAVAAYGRASGVSSKVRLLVRQLTFETDSGIKTLWLFLDGKRTVMVAADVGPASFALADVPCTLSGDTAIERTIHAGDIVRTITCVGMGTGHAVCFDDDPDAVDLATEGPGIEDCGVFPDGVNVHFVRVLSRGEIAMRTWERGSGMTLACGTGACAVAAAAVRTQQTGATCIVRQPGGVVAIDVGDTVVMCGPAERVFEGEWPLL